MRNKNKKVIAIFCADLHLSLNPPIWRSPEPDWFAAMKRPLDEIKEIQENHNCPILCAGDIFDRWNSPPELTNWVGEYLPENMYAIPGQHDLPLHNYDDIKRSAYWNLVQQGKIENLWPNDLFNISSSKLTLYGFPYGKDIQVNKNETAFTQIALVHEYCWIDGHAYPNAPKENYLTRKNSDFIGTKLKGYDIVIFGDNHKGFQTNIGSTDIFNCGTLMRRKSDEIDYKPQIGLLYSDGSVEPYYLDTSQDKYLDVVSVEDSMEDLNMKSFIEELEKLGDTDLDFTEAIKYYLQKNKISKSIQNIIIKAMGV